MELRFALILILTLILSGCAGVGPVVQPPPSIGTYYKVQEGDTLWRISKYYGVEVDKIARANRLPDKGKIYEGQSLFIPEASGQPNVQNPGLLEEKSFVWPVEGKVISFYGSIENNIKNKGINIKAKEGANVVASRGGIVSYRDENMKGFGKTIIIDHGDGFSTIYAHNSALLVNLGEHISKNKVIAKVGNTGRADTTQLHFQIRKNKIPQNPFYYLP